MINAVLDELGKGDLRFRNTSNKQQVALNKIRVCDILNHQGTDPRRKAVKRLVNFEVQRNHGRSELIRNRKLGPVINSQLMKSRVTEGFQFHRTDLV